MVPVAVARLLMWRDRIVNLCLYPIIQQILLEFPASMSKQRKDVKDTIARALRYNNVGMFHLIYIYSRYFLSVLVSSVECRELGIEDGGLNIVDAAVSSDVVEDVLLVAAIITKRTDEGGQLGVVGSDGSGIA
jgi:hypothetical protein